MGRLISFTRAGVPDTKVLISANHVIAVTPSRGPIKGTVIRYSASVRDDFDDGFYIVTEELETVAMAINGVLGGGRL